MELKTTISRSYTRKVNLGNYETIDIFCARNRELPMATDEKTIKQVSEELFAMCVADVEKDAKRYKKEVDGIKVSKLIKAVDAISVGNPIDIELYEDLNDIEKEIVQAVKRAYKRSPMYKATLKDKK